MALFHPFRALGCITEAVPFAVQRRGRATFVTVSVGDAWQLYNCAKLTLVLVCQPVGHTIQALAAREEFTYAAYGSSVAVFRRAHRVATWQCAGDVVTMLPLGDLVLSVTSSGLVTAWPAQPGEEGAGDPVPVFPPVRLPAGFAPTCCCHPDAYLNKLLLGASDGRLALVNFATGATIHVFTGFGCSVRCLVGSPALDVVALGLQDGRCVLHNLRFDETLATFTHDTARGAVTALSFRTGPGAPLLAVGGSDGCISLWDLDARRIHSLVKEAHDAPVVSLHFFVGEPVLMSSGGDNALKHWILDQPEGAPRLLRFRSGHAAPPVVVQFYGDGKRVLSAGSDRAFRVFSTIQDQQSVELSQRHVAHRAKKLRVAQQELKLPPVTAAASCQLRERDWCNVVTCHADSCTAYTWRLSAGALGEHVLAQPQGGGAAVTAVALSPCGNYALLGGDSGHVDRFNLQSGLHRGSYMRSSGDHDTATAARTAARRSAKPGKQTQLWTLAGPKRAREAGDLAAHDGTVTFLDVDACNTACITAGRDGAIRTWGFKQRTVSGTAHVGAPVERGAFHRGSSLLACACGDTVVRVFDVSACPPRRVRTFGGHGDCVTDVALSTDARWLLTSSLDGALRVFDLPSGTLLQALRLGEAPVTAFALAPDTAFLATAHRGQRGISLWANRLVFSPGTEAQSSSQPGAAARVLDVRAPGVGDSYAGEGDEEEGQGPAMEHASLVEAEEAADGEDEPGEIAHLSTEAALALLPLARQAGPRLVTLALLPRAQVQALLHLDTLKARAKPEAPPAKPEAAPFFLPTTPGLARNPVFDTDAAPGGGGQPRSNWGASRVAHVGRLEDGGPASRSPLLRAIMHGDATAATEHIRGVSASALDVELRSLTLGSPDPADLLPEHALALHSLLAFLTAQLAGGADFELLHATLACVLRIHGDACASHPRLRGDLVALRDAAQASWRRLDGRFQQARGILSFVAGMV